MKRQRHSKHSQFKQMTDYVTLESKLSSTCERFSQAPTATRFCFVGTALPLRRSENKHLPATTNKRFSDEKYVDMTTLTTCFHHHFLSQTVTFKKYRKKPQSPHFLLHHTARNLVLFRSKSSKFKENVSSIHADKMNDSFMMYESSPITKSIKTSKQLWASRHITCCQQFN